VGSSWPKNNAARIGSGETAESTMKAWSALILRKEWSLIRRLGHAGILSRRRKAMGMRVVFIPKFSVVVEASISRSDGASRFPT